MTLEMPLFEGKDIRITAIDPEQDAAVISPWTHNLDFTHWIRRTPAHPLTVFELKKHFEEFLKESEEQRAKFAYAIRLREGDRLIGLLILNWVSWSNAVTYFGINIADSHDRQAYGPEALKMALAYFFDELNLNRVEAWAAEYNLEEMSQLEQEGFVQEARRRQVLYRQGRFWDCFIYGLLRAEWRGQQSEVQQ
jgi:RimJ/RimL family protein N-acetyltransferase